MNEYKKRWIDKNKEKIARARKEHRLAKREYDKKHRLRNHERIKGSKAGYYQKNKERASERMATYYKLHKEEASAWRKDYFQTERGRMIRKTSHQKRRAQKKAVCGNYTAQQLQEQHQRQRGCCYYCRVKLGKQWHADHVIPLSRGGSNDISNIVIACPSCNMSKHNKLPSEWPEGGRLM